MPSPGGASGSGVLGDTARALQVLGDPVRLRMLRVLARHEFAVGEVARVVQLAQSSTSRHLTALHHAGLLTRRGAGTASIYRAANDPRGPAARAWASIAVSLEGSPTAADDDGRVTAVLAARRVESREFFGRVGGEWDAIRRELFGDAPEAEAAIDLLDPSCTAVDLGCGTGEWSERLAAVVARVIAVDRERSMLHAARQRLAGLAHVRFIEAPLDALPIADATADIAICSLVLHHIENPAGAMAEALRILRPGGRLLVMDMVPHVQEELMRSMGHRHPGFSEADMRAFAAASGARLVRYRRLRPARDAKGPGLFAALLEARRVTSRQRPSKPRPRARRRPS